MLAEFEEKWVKLLGEDKIEGVVNISHGTVHGTEMSLLWM